jgi:hypothetical protein
LLEHPRLPGLRHVARQPLERGAPPALSVGMRSAWAIRYCAR